MKILTSFKKSFPNFNLVTLVKEIEDNLSGCKSILDVGCGNNSPLRLLSKPYKMVGVDGFDKAIAESKQRKIHQEYILGDVRKLTRKFDKKSFDCVIALDVIEHLTKEEGYIFLANLEKIAGKRVILVTPNGFIEQYKEHNKLQEHLSAWTTEDFQKIGYKVIGLYGHKFFTNLRTVEGELRYQPRLLWGLIWGILAEVMHYTWTKKHPQQALELLAVKKIHH